MRELKQYPVWVRALAELEATETNTITDLAKKFKKSRNLIYKYLDMQEIQDWIEERRDGIFQHIRSNFNKLLILVEATYKEHLEIEGTSKLKLDAARDVAKGLRLFSETQEVNVSGVEINIVPPKREK